MLDLEFAFALTHGMPIWAANLIHCVVAAAREEMRAQLVVARINRDTWGR